MLDAQARSPAPHHGSASREEAGFWSRLGSRLFGTGAGSRPRTEAIITKLVLEPMTLGPLDLNTNLSQLDVYRGYIRTVQGQRLISQSFPIGLTAPADVVLPAGKLQAVMTAAKTVPGVADVPATSAQTSGDLAQFPGRAQAAFLQQQRLADDRRAPRGDEVCRGPTALVGGDTAQASAPATPATPAAAAGAAGAAGHVRRLGARRSGG